MLPLQDIEPQFAQTQTDIEKIDVENTLAWELRNSDAPRATALVEKASTLATKLSYKKGIAESLRTRGYLDTIRFNFSSSKSLGQESLALFQELGDRKGEADALHILGIAYYKSFDYITAQDYFEKSLAIRQAIDDRNGEADSLICLGAVYEGLCEYSKTLCYIGQGLEIFKTVGDQYGEAIALGNFGLVYFRLSDYAKALSCFEQSLTIYQAIGHRKREAYSLSNIGAVYESLSDYAKALAYHEQSLTICQAMSDLWGEATSLHNIGVVYERLSDNAKALMYHERSLKLYQSVNDQKFVAGSLHQLGNLHRRLGEEDMALDFYERSLKIRQAIGDRHGESDTLNELGRLVANSSDSAKALDFYQQSLKIRQAIGYRYGEACCWLDIGKLYLKNPSLTTQANSHGCAVHCLSTALAIATDINAKTIIYAAHEALSQANEQIDNLALALEHHRKFHQLRQDVFNAEQTQKIQALQTALQIEQVHKEAEIFKLRNVELAKAYQDVQTLNASLQQSNISLAAANQFKSDLIAMASHDLKNPLQVILGFSRLVSETPDNAELAAEAAEMIHQVSNKMFGLLNDLLNSAVVNGTLELIKVQVSMADLVRASLAGLDLQAKLKQQRLTLSRADDVTLWVDANRITEVVDNLVTNAIKFSPVGSVINVRLFKTATAVRLEVQDQGPGLSDADQRYLFKRFRKLSGQPTGGESSSGFGLFIVKQLVELHGGKVWAESDGLGKGTTFIVELPDKV
jgi:signal transduction histidine kinase